jgi:hypothetical protein
MFKQLTSKVIYPGYSSSYHICSPTQSRSFFLKPNLLLLIVCSQMINQTVSFFMFLLRVKTSKEEDKEEDHYI